jgi:hypothetical protein
MENGGRGEHRPWKLDEEVVGPYRYFAKLHQQLVPYLYGLGVEAHEGGDPIIRNPDRELRQYRLGEDVLVAPLVTRDEKRRVELPGGSRWYDYWDEGEAIPGGTSLNHDAPLEQIPLFIRAGAIIPMDVEDDVTGHGSAASRGALTLLLYPEGQTKRVLRPTDGTTFAVDTLRDTNGVSVTLGAWTQPLVLRIKEPAKPTAVNVSSSGANAALPEMSSSAELEQAATGWAYDAERGLLWVRLAAPTKETVVQYGGSR